MNPSEDRFEGAAAAEPTSHQTKNGSSSLTDVESRINRAEEYKVAGNGYFKDGMYKAGIGKYHRALLYLKGILSKNEQNNLAMIFGSSLGSNQSLGNISPFRSSEVSQEITEKILALEADCYNNLAACLLHEVSPNYEKIILYCDNVLLRNPDSTKAYYRRGISHYHLGQYEEALKDLYQAKVQARNAGGADHAIDKFLSLCEDAITKKRQSEKQEMMNTKLYKCFTK